RLGKIDRLTGLERPRLAELHRDVAGLRGGQGEASRRQVAELVAPLRVGERGLRADVGPVDANLRAAHRRAGVGGEHAAADAPGAGLRLAAGRQHLDRPAVAAGADDLDLLTDFLGYGPWRRRRQRE